MIRFDEGTRRFNLRVAGVAIHDGSVLLHRADEEAFWTLPGGRPEHGEAGAQALAREMREELDTKVDVVRLLWFVENFFDYGGLQYHEIALYFLMRFPDQSLPRTAKTFDRTDAGVRLRFEWHPIQSELLARLPLRPEFLPGALMDLPGSVTHIIQRDSAVSAAALE